MKQKSYYQIFGSVFLSLICLTACPSNESSSEATPSPTITDTTHQTQASNIPKISEAFKETGISCCWDDLLKMAEKQGFDYHKTVVSAFAKDKESIKKLLTFSSQLSVDIAYGHGAVLDEMLVRLGDQTAAAMLTSVDLTQKHRFFDETLQVTLRNALEGGFMFHKDNRIQVLSLSDFPQTSKVLDYKIK